MRELFRINKEDFGKLEKEDRRFLLNINHAEFLFNESMLLQNRILVIAVFALLVGLLSLIIPLPFISNILKITTTTLFSIFCLWLIILFSSSVIRVKNQNNTIKKGYGELFRYHFNYINKNKNFVS